MSSVEKEKEINTKPPTATDNKKPFVRRNSLVENNTVAKWVNDILMKKMDEYAYVRSMMALVILAYFLGNNLGIYLSLFIGFTIYLFALRIMRAWVKRWLLYMLEFCYYGCLSVVIYLALFPQSRIMWSITYICSTGVLTWAAFIFQNQARMDSSDHLISSYIHSFPMITVWAVRWREHLYDNAVNQKIKYNLIDFSGLTCENDEYFSYLIIFPFIFWICWGTCYFITCKALWSDYVINPKYFSGISDFKSSSVKNLPKLYGSQDHMLLEKYLLTHFILFLTVFPISLICYYSFYFNTFIMISTITFLAWNAGRSSRKAMERMIKKIEEGMCKHKDE